MPLIPKIRIQTVNADNGGCGKYRIFDPIQAVESMDSSFVFSHAAQLNSQVAAGYDIVIFQRPLNRVYADSISFLQSRGVKVIVDIDDDFEAVHRNNTAYWGIQPENSPNFNWEWLLLACKRSDLVITSTEYLASKYKSDTGGSVVIPNYLPNDILSINGTQNKGRVRIGWTGRVKTHPEDLLEVGNSIQKAVRKRGADFVIVGDGVGAAEQVKLEQREIHATGNVPLNQYYRTVANNIDIGIAPLQPSEFNEAKSYLKMLEYSGLGIPSIGSPTAENLLLHEDGIGIIAHTQAEWARALSLLISSDRKREQMGLEARRIVKEKYTLNRNAHVWADTWKKLLGRGLTV